MFPLQYCNNNDYLDLLLSLESSIADAVADIHDLIEDSLEVTHYMIFTAIVVLNDLAQSWGNYRP